MPSDILTVNSHLVGLWLQLFAAGAYFFYLPQCWFILGRKLREGLSLWMPIACVLMAMIVVTDLLVEMHRSYHAYSVPDMKSPPNPAAAYADPATPESLVKNSITVALAIISDVIIVYRTYVVWDFRYSIVLVPTGLLFGDVALGIWSTWTLSQTKGNVIAPILAEVSVRVRYFFIVTFCLNALCASLICYKIWRVSTSVSQLALSADRTMSRVLEVVIETAALYCAHLFIMIVADSVGSNIFFVFLDALPPVTGLVFTLLIVRTRTKTEMPMTVVSDIRFWSTSQTVQGPHTRSGPGSMHLEDVNMDLGNVVRADLESLRRADVSEEPYKLKEP